VLDPFNGSPGETLRPEAAWQALATVWAEHVTLASNDVEEVTEADLPHLGRCIELATEAVEARDFPFGPVLDERAFGRRSAGQRPSALRSDYCPEVSDAGM
jgi:hypothetical protein